MSLSCRVICCVALIVICFSSCNSNTERDSYPQADIIAELEHVIINEIFNEPTFFEMTNIKKEYNTIRSYILENCKYYSHSGSNISICVCYWGERQMSVPFYKTVCLLDSEEDIKLCFNFNDWKCFDADNTTPCFDVEWMESIKDCKDYKMLANYLNYYIDNLSSKNDVQSEIHNALNVEEISAVVDSVLDLVYFSRVNQDNSFIIDRAFDNIERDYRRDESGCCFQVIHENKRCLQELLKTDDVLVYFDAGLYMYWFVWINPNPKDDIFGRKYITVVPFNYECVMHQLYL